MLEILRTELECSGTAPAFDDLRVNGTLNVADGIILHTSGSPIIQDLQASAQLCDNWFSISSASGRVGNGTASANLMGTWSRQGIEEWTGQLKVQGADLTQCKPWLADYVPLARGTADLDYVFFKTWSCPSVEGYGRFQLLDADLMRLPVIPDLFSPLGLPPAGPMILSDGLLEFTHLGPTVRINQSRFFNSVAALIAESGGTIRLDNGHLDLFVIGVPIRAVEDLLSKIPLIRVFNRATNTLVRSHVLGNWSEPPDRLIQQEPLENLQESVKGLLEDLTRGGIDLADQVRRTGRSVWRKWFENDRPKPAQPTE